MTNHPLNTEYIIVGKIGSTHGVKGWLKIISFTENTKNILQYNPWYIEETENHWKKWEVQNGQEHGKRIIAKLAGLNTPEEARLLNSKNIAILRTQLPKLAKNEYYWNDLQGLTVINQHHEILGQVMYLIATGANDVLIVKGKIEHAIPYLPHSVIKDIDLTEKVIHVNWDMI